MPRNAELTGMRGGFAPVADGINIPKGTFYSEANGVSSDVPMIICSTFHEWGIGTTDARIGKNHCKRSKRIC